MVKRVLGALLLVLVMVMMVAGQSAQARPIDWDPPELGPPKTPPVYRPPNGIIPPSLGSPNLVDAYPPDELKWYTQPGGWTPSGMKRSVQTQVSDILAACQGFLGLLVALAVRLLDMAWNLNIADLFGTVMDKVAIRFYGVLWGLGYLAALGIAGWILGQVARGAYSRLTGGLLGMLLIMGVAAYTSGGMSKIMAQAEEVTTELAVQILRPPGPPGNYVGTSGLTDALYQQLILEPWAKGNFVDMDTAKKYSKDGIAGARHWDMSEQQTEDTWEQFEDSGRTGEILPWYDNPVGKRMAIVFTTFLAVLFTIPFLAGLCLVLLGVKMLGFFLGAMWPAAVFIAMMPFLRGPSFLRGYAVWTFMAPILKIVFSFVLAAYMAFLGGATDSANTLPGGWATICLLMAAFTFVAWLVSKPIFNLVGGLIFKSDQEKVREKSAPREVIRESRDSGTAGGEKRRRTSMHQPSIQQPKAKKQTPQTPQPPIVTAPTGEQPPAEKGHSGRRLEVVKYLKPAGRRGGGDNQQEQQSPLQQHHQRAQGQAQPIGAQAKGMEMLLRELLKEARRAMDLAGKAVGGGGK